MDRRVQGKNTRQEILEAASQVFIEKGYEGASISDIACLKEMNQSLIYHYFDNKRALWEHTKEFLLKEYVEGGIASIDTRHGLRHFLMNFCRYSLEYLVKHPGVTRILTWQRLQDRRNKLGDFKLAEKVGFEKAFLDMQNKGEIRQDLDPHLVTVLIRSFIRAPFFDDFSEIGKDSLRQQLYLETIVGCIEKAVQP
ncbi:MAG: TetR/AcrR family transcriptional regulator [Simkania sp.]|nr:TetR/AcrR family transcriptional regulator [Simkania sp.]